MSKEQIGLALIGTGRIGRRFGIAEDCSRGHKELEGAAGKTC